MNKTFINYENDSSKTKKGVLLILFLMLTFGVYKNGFKYYQTNLLGAHDVLKIVLYPIISIIIQVIYIKIIQKKSLKSEDIIESLVLAILLPVRFPLSLYLVTLLIYFLVKYFFKQKINTISLICLYKVFIMICNAFLGLNYENIIENSNPYFYGIVATLFGSSVGGLGTTNIFLIIILFLIMQNDFYYKKSLVFYMLMPFFLLTILSDALTTHNIIITNLLNSDIVFASVFLLPEPGKTPAVPTVAKIYAFLIGIFSFLLVNFFSLNDMVYLVILSFQIIWSVVLYYEKIKLHKKN